MKSLHPTFALRLVLVIFFCAFFLSSCEDDEDTNDFWTPGISVQQGNQQATVSVYDPTLLALRVGPPLDHPDFFNILISEDQQDFKFYRRVPYTESNVLVENLTNGKSYYFKVRAERGNESHDSNVVMTIPSEPVTLDVFLAGDLMAKKVSLSYDMNYVATTYNGTTYFTADGETTALLTEKSGGGVAWASETNTATYVSEELVGNALYPSVLKVYEAGSAAPTEILQILYDRFYVFNPAFIPGSDNISFLSSENNADITRYDIWKIDPESKERSRITDLAATGFILYGNYDWSSSPDLLYLDAMETITSPAAIFAFNTVTGAKTSVIRSQWNDQRPSVSPDDKKIAFSSGRTGSEEIWLYDLETSTYRQVTGSEGFRFDARYSNLQWLSPDEILVTIFKDDKWEVVKLNLI